MKIAIDISQAAYQGTGVGRYVSEMAKTLVKYNTKHELIFFAFTLRRREYFRQLATQLGHKIRVFPLPPKLLPFLAQFSPIPLDILIGSPALLHTSDWAEPKSLCPRVTTVHDLVFRLYQETVDPLVLAAQKKRLDRIIKDNTTIIADSLCTKNDLERLYNISPPKIEVVYPGISTAYQPVSIKSIEQVKKKYHLHQPYLLSVGTQEPRKNLKKTIAAHQILRRQKGWEDLELVLVGRYGWGESPTIPPGVISLGYVNEQELPAIYSGASVFVYPSLYEGFGYPVIEAMACGTPVVTSNISSLPEITNGAAILVDPNDELDLVAGIIAARQNKAELVQKGYLQAAKFCWHNFADQLISVYERTVA